ncbi:MAG: hypothetical protein IJ867_02525 [Clostridia bacterium]|nr:hypothetical protein [Clostridia bacterium]
MIKTLLLSIIWLVVIPSFVGLAVIKFAKQDNKNIFLAYIVRNVNGIFGF